MATLTNANPTLMDWAKSLDPDGQVAAVVELLNQTNEMMADMTYVEGNLVTGHRHTIRTGLPTPTWRKLYQGVQPTKSKREQVTDTCGMLEDYSKIDKALADLNGNTAEFMLSESRAHIEGMTQELQNTVLYGDVTLNPERFEGLSTRYNDLSAQNADNIIDAGGTGTDNRSIWLIVWGPETVHGIFPKGSQAGISVTPKGAVTIQDQDGAGGMMEAYLTHFRMDAGLTVRDWRYIVRIANIDKSLLTADASTGANLPNLMAEAIDLIPSMGMGRAAFYMSRDVRTKWRQQMANAVKQSTLTTQDVGGVKSPMFDEIPIRRVDKLAVDEARVV